MRKVTLLLIVVVHTVACRNEAINNKDKFNQEFYTVLNSLIQYRLTDIAVVVNETMPVYKNIYGDFNDSLELKYPPPPPLPGVISYDKNNFNAYVERHYVDSADATFMYNSIDSTMVLEIDSSQLVIPVITVKQMDEIFNSADPYAGYENLTKKYGKHCYIVVSTPIFNSDFTKVVISIDHLCGPLWGQGHEFILEKRNGKWWLLYDGGTWVS
jgi:hypothetical protein